MNKSRCDGRQRENKSKKFALGGTAVKQKSGPAEGLFNAQGNFLTLQENR